MRPCRPVLLVATIVGMIVLSGTAIAGPSPAAEATTTAAEPESEWLQNPCLAEDASPKPCTKAAEDAYVQRLADQEVAAFKARYPKATAAHLDEIRRQTLEQYEDSKALRGP